MKAQIKVGLLHPNYKHSHESIDQCETFTPQ